MSDPCGGPALTEGLWACPLCGELNDGTDPDSYRAAGWCQGDACVDGRRDVHEGDPNAPLAPEILLVEPHLWIEA